MTKPYWEYTRKTPSLACRIFHRRQWWAGGMLPSIKCKTCLECWPDLDRIMREMKYYTTDPTHAATGHNASIEKCEKL